MDTKQSRLNLALILLLCTGLSACGSGSGPVASPAHCDQGSAKTLRAKTLLIGADVGTVPYVMYGDDGKLTGFDVELIRAVGQQAGLQVEFVSQSNPGLVAGLIAQRFDGVSGLRTTPNNQRQVCFTKPYLSGDFGVIVKESQTKQVSDVAALPSGSLVAVQRDSASLLWAEDHLDRGSVVKVATASDVAASVADGKARAGITDAAFAMYVTKSDPKIATGQIISTDQSVALAIHPGTAGIGRLFDSNLAKLKRNGTYNTIYRKWFGRSPSPK